VPAFAASAARAEARADGPGVAQTVILARHGRRASAMPAGERLAALAEHQATLVIHLGTQAIEEIAATLDEHYGGGRPAPRSRRTTSVKATSTRASASANGPGYQCVTYPDSSSSRRPRPRFWRHSVQAASAGSSIVTLPAAST